VPEPPSKLEAILPVQTFGAAKIVVAKKIKKMKIFFVFTKILL
jgi:hypothetical protein